MRSPAAIKVKRNPTSKNRYTEVNSVRPAQKSGAFLWCAEHVRQLEGESPFDNLMEVKS
jgi:hypothetical protein